MDFITDAKAMKLSYEAYVENSAKLYPLYYFDIYVNDFLTLHHGENDIKTNKKDTIQLNL